MIRSVTITSETELEEVWTDTRCPNMSWSFIESSMDECLQDDGTYVATYETLEIPTGETKSFTYLTASGESTYILQAGEYGVKPE